MVPVLNLIGTDVSCVGVCCKYSLTQAFWLMLAQNHDLDFGVKQFRSLAQQCSFPWLIANVLGE
jgi:5'-nucleotidase